MQRHRFFAPPSKINDSEIILDSEESHHISRVLRMKSGDRIFIFDGKGAEWECEITNLDKNTVSTSILHKLDETVESPLHLTLACSLLKSDKFDWIVQKSTELGVTRIVPLNTKHIDIRLRDEKTDKLITRWKRISLEALKQCGRRCTVEITQPTSFTDFCKPDLRTDTTLIFSEKGGRELKEVKSTIGSLDQLSICVASEGGWSDEELSLAENRNFIPISLGPRILRAETAAIAAMALTQHLFGDV